MQLGTALHDATCARCHCTLSVPSVFRDQQWYHLSCWQEGEEQLINTMLLATALKKGIFHV
jgi:hypothetical protein